MSDDYGYTVIVKKETSIIVKLIWLFILCLLFACFGFYVLEDYRKYNIEPEITISNDYIRSDDIPYPAVTICSPLLIKNEFLNVTKYFTNTRGMRINPEDRGYLTAAVHACFDRVGDILYPDLNRDEFDQNTPVILNAISPTIMEMFHECNIEGSENCTELFIRSLTEDGYCFTFNMLGYHSIFNGNVSKYFDSYKRKSIPKSWKYDERTKTNRSFHDDENNPEPSLWTLQDGYLTNESSTQPLRAKRSKINLLMVMKDVDIPNLCEARRHGYKVILHLPNELPTIFHSETYFQLKSLKSMSISAEVIEYDDTLRRLPPEQRGCYFEGERQLGFFKSYTQRNCEYECMTNYTLKTCGCVKFSMPRNRTTKFCEDLDIYCYHRLVSAWPDIVRTNPSDLEGENVYKFPCNCIQSCTQLNYKIVSERSFEMNQENSPRLLYIGSITSENQRQNETLSFLEISFKDFQILKTTHFTAYEIQNFISDIGGLLGLFLGVSLISIFEVMSKIIKQVRKRYKNEESEVKVVNIRQVEVKPYKKPAINAFLTSLQLSSTNARKVNEMDRKLFGETCAHR